MKHGRKSGNQPIKIVSEKTAVNCQQNLVEWQQQQQRKKLEEIEGNIEIEIFRIVQL